MVGRLTELADDPHLRPLWTAVHARLCRGKVTATSTITIRDADPDTRRAVDRLLGQHSTAGQLKVSYGKLDDTLGLAGTTAVDVARAVGGPIVDRSAQRAETAAATNAAWDVIGAHPAASEPAISRLLESIRTSGRLNRAGGLNAVIHALDVLAVLPWNGSVLGRPVLAATVMGDEHALDDSTPTGRLVLAGLAARAGNPTPGDAAGRAALWAASGVSLDAVSAPVLALALRPAPVGPITEAARRWADSGVPLPVPVGALTMEAWSVAPGTVVSVCENPSVIEAAAARYGGEGRPLICVAGMPSRAAHLLLASLVSGGAWLRYHGDFGAGGITIANLVIGRHGAQPWRMSAADHQAAVEQLASQGRTPNRLRGRVPEAAWDPHLRSTIEAYDREITEEHVLEPLIADLTPDSSAESRPAPDRVSGAPRPPGPAWRVFADESPPLDHGINESQTSE